MRHNEISGNQSLDWGSVNTKCIVVTTAPAAAHDLPLYPDNPGYRAEKSSVLPLKTRRDFKWNVIILVWRPISNGLIS
jgi:hypothetical protein